MMVGLRGLAQEGRVPAQGMAVVVVRVVLVELVRPAEAKPMPPPRAGAVVVAQEQRARLEPTLLLRLVAMAAKAEEGQVVVRGAL